MDWNTTTVMGLTYGVEYTLNALARNGDGVQTAPSPGASILVPVGLSEFQVD